MRIIGEKINGTRKRVAQAIAEAESGAMDLLSPDVVFRAANALAAALDDAENPQIMDRLVERLGAQAVGMGAVLMDVAGAYREKSHPRIESLTELEAHLEQLHTPSR